MNYEKLRVQGDCFKVERAIKSISFKDYGGFFCNAFSNVIVLPIRLNDTHSSKIKSMKSLRKNLNHIKKKLYVICHRSIDSC